jgi:serine/threonine protein kinase
MFSNININKISSALLNPRLKQSKQLDFNTLLIESNIGNNEVFGLHGNNGNMSDHDLAAYNLKVKNETITTNNIIGNISADLEIIKYIGEGINGKLYLAKDKLNNNLYICKKIGLDTVNNNKSQIEFELNILKYLSSNRATKPFINPCVNHKIVDNNIYTIFPIFNGYSLSNLNLYLSKLKPDEYYQIIFFLIKTLLQGLAVIHKSNIAHQNISENAILVSTFNTGHDITVKYTDFGLGCGNYRNLALPSEQEQNQDKYFQSCTGTNIPLKITKDIMETLSKSDFLKLAQKYDVFCLGIILLKLLLPNENIKINPDKGYTKHLKNTVLTKIQNKYIKTNSENTTDFDYVAINVSLETKRDIVEYLRLIIDKMITLTKNREPCQYVLDKLIIYEKYKNESF